MCEQEKPVDAEMAALTPYQKLLIEQRDKQVDQFMKVNGQAAFAVLTATFAVMFGADDARGLLSGFPEWGRTVLIEILVLGVLALTGGVLWLSAFHTRKIRQLQVECAEQFRKLPAGSFELVPPRHFSYMPIFGGLFLIACFAIFIMLANMIAGKT